MPQELERAVARTLDRAQLLVYADALQAAGDPRGELIAIDLHLEGGADPGANPDADPDALRARRAELLREWLGDLAPRVRTRFGFLELRIVHDGNEVADVLDADVGRFVRAVHIREPGERERAVRYGLDQFVPRILEHLAHEPRPHLVELSLALTADPPSIPASLVAAFVEAAPALDVLELTGVAPAGFAASSVRQLRLSGAAAVRSVLAAGPYPAVTELDLAVRVGDGVALPDPAIDAPLFAGAQLPALRVLDLSRNEPGAAAGTRHLGGLFSLFDRLAHWDLATCAALRDLRLPSLRRPADLAAVDALLAAHPALRIEIARSYRGSPAAPARPRLLRPPTAAWPAYDHALGARFVIHVPGPDIDVELDEGTAILLMESTTRLPADVLAAWDEVWAALSTARATDGSGTLPVTTVSRALDAIDARDFGWRWRKLRAALSPLRIDTAASVTIRVS